MSRSLFFGGAVTILGIALMLFAPGVRPAQADKPRADARWTFDLTKASPVPGTDAERMYGLVFEVDALGAPRLVRAMDLPGRAPEYREMPDVGRIYRWVIRDAAGLALAEGRHFDALSVLSPEPEGPCVRRLAGPHAVGIRTPKPAGAQTIELTIDRVVGDTEESR